jgi:predicted phosphodiesterase
MNHALHRLSRRAFLTRGSLVLASASLNFAALKRLAADEDALEALRIGLVTDLHHADKPSNGTRHYRETLAKLTEAGEQFARDKPAFLVELGDLIDAADSVETELGYLRRVNREFAMIAKDRHYVLGNHCVDMLTKAEFLGGVEREQSFYSFDRGGFHFIVLDACYRSDGQDYGRKNSKWNDANIPATEVEWLRGDLQKTDRKTIVFVHQRLDVSTDHGVKNCAEVRKVLEDSRRVLAVLQGHSHQNDHKEIAGIHYTTLRAMVEGSGVDNNGYSLMRILPDGTIVLKGFRKQSNYDWAAGS